VTDWRKVGAAVAAVGAAGATTVLVATPAAAHGATSSPASRGQLCGEREAGKKSSACRAARAVSGQKGIADWDNLRLANVDGRDRTVVPDGKLCSGGITRFRGLDLARTDWPATELTAGAAYKFRYRVTIPHPGTFKLFVTKDGYDASRPLKWTDLERRPFMSAANPRRVKGAYVMRGRLPRNKSGRHLIYAIWQTNPDTYYSCSDVEFREPPKPKSTGGAAAGGTTTGGGPSAAPSPARDGGLAAVPVGTWAPVAAGGLGAVIVGGIAIALIVRRVNRRAAERRSEW
jgi:predicted carbohydrate-binding protein with CBM5 and CBM33 domain